VKPLYVAVVGATGLMGRELLKLLEKRQFPLTSLQLLASDRSAGKQLFFNHQEIEVKELTSASLSRLNLVFFAASTEASRRFSPTAVKNGAVVIDQSATYRMEPWVPLVVPEVNLEDLKDHKRIIASPSAATIQMVMALAPLHRVNPIRRAVVATYQSVSGAGAAAMEELTNQAKQVLEGKGVIPHVFTHQTAFNLLPEIDVFLYNGYTMEEWRIKEEAAKLMHSPDLAISASCVRVPVYIGDSQAIHLEFTNPIAPEEARRLLAEGGYPGGAGFPAVELVYSGDTSSNVTASYLAKTWEAALGVKVGLSRLEWGELLRRGREDPPDMTISGWAADYPDPDDMLRVVFHGHPLRWHNAKFDALVEEAAQITDRKRRIDLYQEADRILVADEAAVLPLGYAQGRQLVKAYVRMPRTPPYLLRLKHAVVERPDG